MSANERSGWRHEALSLRHRKWGFNAPMHDVDFLVVEYDNGEPVALVEYKLKGKLLDDPEDRINQKSHIRLGDRASLPFFVVRYTENLHWYQVIPMNPRAKELLSIPHVLCEFRYVGFLHWLRGRKMDDDQKCQEHWASYFHEKGTHDFGPLYSTDVAA